MPNICGPYGPHMDFPPDICGPYFIMAFLPDFIECEVRIWPFEGKIDRRLSRFELWNDIYTFQMAISASSTRPQSKYHQITEQTKKMIRAGWAPKQLCLYTGPASVKNGACAPGTDQVLASSARVSIRPCCIVVRTPSHVFHYWNGPRTLIIDPSFI